MALLNRKMTSRGIVEHMVARVLDRHSRKIFDHEFWEIWPAGVKRTPFERRRLLQRTRQILARNRHVPAILVTAKYFHNLRKHGALASSRAQWEVALRNTPGILAIGRDNRSEGIITFKDKSRGPLLRRRHEIVNYTALAKNYWVCSESRRANVSNLLSSSDMETIIKMVFAHKAAQSSK